jgi:hypothetical protein
MVRCGEIREKNENKLDKTHLRTEHLNPGRSFRIRKMKRIGYYITSELWI